MKAVAMNIGAKDESPGGGRGPIYENGSFRYVPIPESVDDNPDEPTYENLGLDEVRRYTVHDDVVHFDPEFPEIGWSDNYTHGERKPPRIYAIRELEAGDVLFFYATLDYESNREPEYPWINEDWGAYIIGHFVLEYDPIPKEGYHSLPQHVKERFATNAHVRRDPFDAEYLILGNSDESKLYDVPIPLSGATGPEPNEYVTSYSNDSGKKGWYRRSLHFDEEEARALLKLQRELHEQDRALASPEIQETRVVDSAELGSEGQLQFFFHSSESELPVRDIVGRGKMEPHIEKRAENYCNECYQQNIRTFARDDDRRYLFLFTRCQNSELDDHYDERYLVGYIDKKRELDMGEHVAVQGPTTIVGFDDAIPLGNVPGVDSPNYVRVQRLRDEETVQNLVEQLDSKPNVYDDCLDEIKRLEQLDEDTTVPSPSDVGC